MEKFIAYDLGTGGIKASLYDETLQTLARTFIEYNTYYPAFNYHEQKPADWWKGVIQSTRRLIRESGTNPKDIACLAVSGHSLVTVPLDRNGSELLEQVPIWSDKRADEEAKEFFERIAEEKWYMSTGNGFPPSCYSIFKLMWLKMHYPDIYRKIDIVLGSKDYINYKFTGEKFTDYSYASGTGSYDLIHGCMNREFLDAADLNENIFPQIVPSHHIIGHITLRAAEETGLSANTVVACGGVDNACMALGSIGTRAGSIYTSLGSSSWIAVNSETPVLDIKDRTYTFAHAQENFYTSALSIFAGGSCLRWVRDNICRDLSMSVNPYDDMTDEIRDIPAGSNGIIFNPSLAGGTALDKSANLRGAFLGLSLSTTRAEMIHAAMEGIALNLKFSLDSLKHHVKTAKQIQFCGGGSKNPYWMQMFADIFDMEIVKTNIDQDAASIGAAAIAVRAYGLWKDYSRILLLHQVEFICKPNPENVEKYKRILPVFAYTSDMLSDYGDYIEKLNF